MVSLRRKNKMSNPKQEFTHLGDGVYARYDVYGVMLHINDQLNPTDRVFLDRDVLKALNNFFASATKANRPTQTG